MAGGAGAKRDLLKVAYEIPDTHRVEALDWSSSNARRLFDIGYRAGLAFCDEHPAELGLAAAPPPSAAVKPAQRRGKARPAEPTATADADGGTQEAPAARG
jgi:hypothetical protein